MKATHPVCKPENFGFFLAGELQRILDHAIIVQPCRSLDQKDNKNLQGPGEQNQKETLILPKTIINHIIE